MKLGHLTTVALLVVAAGGALYAAQRGVRWWRSRLPPPRDVTTPEDPGLFRLHEGDAPNDEFGITVASIGDVNGDGVDEYACGAMFYGDDDRGRVVLFDGATGARVWEMDGTNPGARLGYGLSTAGDVDGDGRPDVLAGATRGTASLPDVEPASAGAALILSGKDGAVLRVFASTNRHDEAGHAVAGGRDIDGDGVPDQVVSAPGTYRENSAGWVEWFSGADGRRIHRVTGPDELGDRFGFAVCLSPDLDGDGAADVVVGSLGDDDNGTHCGAVYVFSGATGDLLHRTVGDSERDELGHHVDIAPDRNGDGIPEILAGAFRPSGPCYMRLISGADGSTIQDYGVGSVDEGLGHSVTVLGDVDGDGIADFAGGAPETNLDDFDTVGAVVVFSGATGEELARYHGRSDRERLGYVVGRGGDLNGDGIPELLVGSNRIEDRAGIVRILTLSRP